MKTVKVKLTDFPGPFNPTRILALLRQRYEVVTDDDAPDYVIYSVNGHGHLRHPDAVRIFFTGENIHPDFNICDYSFGYDWMNFGDRHYRCPNYLLYDQFKELCQRLRTQMPIVKPSSGTAGFCNFIYTSSNGHPFREEFFELLSQYRRVDSPGAHRRNMNVDIGPAYQGDWSASKVAFQRNYKFSFAFENSSTIGYTTEKIVHALAADTIPIYWGNPDIGREFNPRRFVNCHEYADAEAALERVIQIDKSDELYQEILAEPYFLSNEPLSGLSDGDVLDQFEHIFSQPKQAAYRRSFHAWGAHYERQRQAEVSASAFLKGNGVVPRLARLLRRLV